MTYYRKMSVENEKHLRAIYNAKIPERKQRILLLYSKLGQISEDCGQRAQIVRNDVLSQRRSSGKFTWGGGARVPTERAWRGSDGPGSTCRCTRRLRCLQCAPPTWAARGGTEWATAPGCATTPCLRRCKRGNERDKVIQWWKQCSNLKWTWRHEYRAARLGWPASSASCG